MPTVANRPMSVKLRPWLDEALRSEFEERGESPSEGLRRILEEWWVDRHLEDVEFREGVSGRRAAVEGGPEVWEIVAALRDHDGDREALAEHFGWLRTAALDAALAFYDRFPDRIDTLIDENERVGRYLSERLG